MFEKELFATRLKQLREESGITRTVLAQLCGLHANAVAAYERCEAKPGIESVMGIAEFFDISVDFLLGRTDCRGVRHNAA